MKLIHSELQPFSAIPAVLTQLISGQDDFFDEQPFDSR